MPQTTASRAMGFVVLVVLVVFGAAVWSVFVSPTLSPRFIDERGKPPVTPRPAARNTCEQVFAEQLITAWQPNAVPSPDMRQVRTVFDACTADELLGADARSAFIVGEPMAYLSSHRLFNGPHVDEQFARLCAAQELAGSTACRTRSR